MKKILVTRKLLKSNEEKLKKLFDVRLNLNDELYSQEKLIKMSEGCDGILSALTDKLDEKTINRKIRSRACNLCRRFFVRSRKKRLFGLG